GPVHHVSVERAKNGLVPDDEHRRLLAFELEDYRLQALNDVLIGLAARIPVPKLVVLARLVLVRHHPRDLGVRHPVAHAGVDLVERAPHSKWELEVLRGLDRATQRARPDDDGRADAVAHDVRELRGVGPTGAAERRVAPDATEHVERALAVPRHPDAPGLDVEVEQEVNDPREQIPLDAVEDHLATDVDDPDEGPLFFADLLVRLLVVRDAQAKVAHRLVFGYALVVGRTGLRGADVGLDDLRIVAGRLDEHDLETDLGAARSHERPPLPRAVGRVVNRDVSPLVEEGEHVFERGHGHVASCLLAGDVPRIEERMKLVAAEARAPVRPDVEHLRP